MEVEEKVKVSNELGLHARPAAIIVKLVEGCNSTVQLFQDKKRADAKSIMDILMLSAKKDSLITIKAQGRDAEEVVQKLVLSFNRRFEGI